MKQFYYWLFGAFFCSFFLVSCGGDDKKEDTQEYHLTWVLNRADIKLSSAQKELISGIQVEGSLAYPDEKSLIIHAGKWQKMLMMEASAVSNFLGAKKSESALERKLKQLELPAEFNQPTTTFPMDSLLAYLETLPSTPILVGLPSDAASIQDTLIKLNGKFDLFWAKNKEELVRYLGTKVSADQGPFELVILHGLNPDQIGGTTASTTSSMLPSNASAEIQEAYSGHVSLMEKVREIKTKLGQLKTKPQTVAVKSEIKGLLKMLTELLQDDEELLSLIKTHPEAKSVEGLVKVLATELKKERQESKRLAEELKAAKAMIRQLEGVVEVQKGVINEQNKAIEDAKLKLSYLQAQLECAFTFKKDLVSKAKEHDYPANGKGISRIAVLCKINENKHVTEGVRNVYLQLISPSGMPGFVRGNIYQNGETLNYSVTAQAIIQKSGSEVKLVLENPDKVRLEEGVWKVKVFDERRKIGETQFEVK